MATASRKQCRITGDEEDREVRKVHLDLSPAGTDELLSKSGRSVWPVMAVLMAFLALSLQLLFPYWSSISPIPEMHLPTNLATIALAALHLGAATAQRPVIRADTNRDGTVNEADDADKAFWTPARGAIFLPNVGDSLRRCANTDLQGNPLSNHELASCNDASGHLLLEPGLVAPLKTAPVDVSDDVFAHIYATPKAAAKRVRLFVNDFPSRASETAAWRLVDPEFIFNATQLKNGISLGIDGREFVTDASEWDGKVTVHFDLHVNTTILSDAVELKVAPVLTHHHLQRVDTLISTAANDSDPSSDIWAQDFIEPAYASMPGPDGPVSIRIVLRSAQSTRTGGRQVFEQLRGKGVGGFQPEGGRRGFGHLEINSFGNLETIPPYTSKSGIRSETGWLVIGHVDEFVQFLPSNKSGLGFTIGIADTVSALEILRNASTAGHGGVRAVSFNGNLGNAFSTSAEELAMTIDQILANETFHQVNSYAQKHIDANLETLLSEIPIAREHVVRVPVLFKDLNMGQGFSRSDDGLPSHTDTVMADEFLVASFSPAAINGIVLGGHYLSPKPWGPMVDGKDLFEERVRAVYGATGMDVGFVDDFLSHHVGLGEIHCGSNTLRETDVKWWE
uniref:Arginine deiminase type-3 n=1 Tax=Colletotrichum fructicola (strain Nara gc5) TaxID=1213859 RepID=L2GHH5_COLFN